MGGEDIGWEPGEVVLSSFPMAHVISASHRGKICHQCWGGFDEGQMCRCGVVFYCGEGCLDEGRVEHERECGLDGLVDLPDKLLLLLRIWLRLKEGDVKEEEEGGRCRRWTDLGVGRFLLVSCTVPGPRARPSPGPGSVMTNLICPESL